MTAAEASSRWAISLRPNFYWPSARGAYVTVRRPRGGSRPGPTATPSARGIDRAPPGSLSPASHLIEPTAARGRRWQAASR